MIMQVAYYAAEAGLNDEQIYSVVRDCDDRWEIYTTRTDRNRQRRLIDLVERARRKHPINELADFMAIITDATESPEVAPKAYLSFKEILNLKVKIKWLLKGLFSTKGYGLIYGTPGIGKTQLAMRMAFALCLGRRFLIWDNPEEEKKKVFFLSLEMDSESLNYFIETMSQDISEEDQEVLDQNFITTPTGEPVPLDKPEGQAYFEGLLKEIKPQIILIDSYSDASFDTLNSDPVARQLANYLYKIRKQYKVAIYLIHHDKKAQKDFKPGTFDDMYGSRWLSAKTDFIISMRWKDNGDIVICEEKRRLGPKEKPFIVRRSKHLNFTAIGEADGDDIVSEVLGALSEITESGNDSDAFDPGFE